MEVKKCQWSQNALNSVKGLLKSDPKVRKSVELIKKHVCDKKKKLVYCCGPEQQPPSDVLFPDCEHLCSKNPSECDLEGMMGFKFYLFLRCKYHSWSINMLIDLR